ncbi:GroES-like protein [Viridothelium virens]|uniref:GroES-like protein n=1 Tax=Viridothelium virens TaxID=1048519 RepID=A0A6A6HCJ1_VIRVR|nr:GroES-like protein [Viridothelium virens]
MSNKAAWITEAKANPLKVDSGPDPKPGAGEVAIKNAAVAINPVDWKIQDYGIFIQHYPNILGCDVAGEVHEVGEGVTHLKKGDRVLGHALNLLTGKPENSGFQLYTVTPAAVAAVIPSSISFHQASVLPLAISTAAVGLYKILKLPLPPASASSAPNVGSNGVLVVWGGSGSVGCVTTQLAKASGLAVVATASKKNFKFVEEMGAQKVVDYNSGDVVKDVVAAVKELGGSFKGVYECIGGEPTKTCVQIAHVLGGGPVATALPGQGVEGTEDVFAPSITQDTCFVKAFWGEFVPAALADGRLKAKPDPIVIKGGLDALQQGVDKQRQGVSAAKVVVDLQS